jgi:hypothetical protein
MASSDGSGGPAVGGLGAEAVRLRDQVERRAERERAERLRRVVRPRRRWIAGLWGRRPSPSIWK